MLPELRRQRGRGKVGASEDNVTLDVRHRASFIEHMRSYSVPWRLAMEKHMLDKTTAEGKTIDEALKALKALKEQSLRAAPIHRSKMW